VSIVFRWGSLFSNSSIREGYIASDEIMTHAVGPVDENVKTSAFGV
jgi:hypothetical protein